MRRTSNKIWLMPDKHTYSREVNNEFALSSSLTQSSQFDCAPFGLTEREA
jgi:hypothetical protein